MIKKELLHTFMAGALSLAFAGQFVYSPVFADNPVNISIVEVVDDGAGGYKPWEDIIGAMPGATYSAIPRVKNDGEIPVTIKMCLTQSATNGDGETIDLPANTFGIEISPNWTLDSTVADPANPATGNCYNYNSEVAVGGVTEPLFTEVTLSSELGNEYENSTFNLHLVAEAIGGDTPSPTPTPTPTPDNPDTGINTVSYFDNVKPIVFSAGIIALFAVVAFVLRKILRKN